MLNQTQQSWVIAQLKRNKKISRNHCLKNYISRLGAIIKRLEYSGWVFKKGYTENFDYEYHLVKMPKV